VLKSRMFALAERPQLLVSEFRNFPELLLRPNIAAELASERESLLGQLFSHLEDARQAFSKFQDRQGDRKSNLIAGNFSPTVAGLIWVNQLVKKIDDASGIVHQVLLDVNRSGDLVQEVFIALY
jgi:hypothetical protein